MRTTLDLPDGLLDEARKLLGFRTKTDTVVMSLTELIRRRRIDELKSMAGQVKLDLDLERSRGRSAGGAAVKGGSRAARARLAGKKSPAKRAKR
jgi:Arc/MetJ family transcription regulator